MKTSLIFFGTEDFSATSLETLLAAGWPIKAVVTKPDFKKGRGQKLSSPKVKEIAQAASVEVLQPSMLTEISEKLATYSCDYGVLVAYGKIIPQSVIDIFPNGIINLHPSLLPKYRGPAPIEAAILNGDNETGVTLMKLSAHMDAGPIYTQKVMPLTGNETQESLYQELASIGADFLASSLPGIIDGSLKPADQDDELASYTKLLTKDDGRLDLSEPAENNERKVRALHRWPRCTLKIQNVDVIVTKVQIVNDLIGGGLVMECNPGYLEILRLIVPGRGEVSGQEFKTNYLK